MKLSMYMLADWLCAFSPVCEIRSEKPTLRNARLFSQATPMERQNVYIGPANSFIDGGEGVICVHENDMIRLNVDDMELVFNEVLRFFDYYNNWADGTRERILEGCTLQEVIDCSQEILDEPMFVHDNGYTVSAISKGFEGLDDEWDYMLKAKSNSIEKIVGINASIQAHLNNQEPFVLEAEVFSFKSVCANLFSYRKHMGWLVVIEKRHRITKGKLQLCAALSAIIEFWLRCNEEQVGSWDNTDIFRDLLDGKSFAYSQLIHRMETFGWNPADDKLVIKIVGTEGLDVNTPLCTQLERNLKGCFTVMYNSSVVVTANLRLIPLPALMQVLEPWLKQSRSCCGVSYVFKDITMLRQHYGQGDIAVQHGVKKPGMVNRCEDYAVAYAFNLLSGSMVTDICHPALGKLLTYDAEHRTELYHTLRVYLLNERNQVKTAEKLNLHRNSLVYRISRINELISAELEDPMVRMHLLLSYYLKDVRR